jgi:hypothetical protein
MLRDIPGGVWYDAEGFPDELGIEYRPVSQRQWSCPYGRPGDLLWVRETWFNPDYAAGKEPIACAGMTYYRATDDPSEWPWRPSIHMPRWASRLILRLTEVRVQRVQEISEEDAIAEGIVSHDKGGKERVGRVMFASRPGDHNEWELSARDAFARAWDAINAKPVRINDSVRRDSWEDNPWVWALSFEPLPAAGGKP